MAEQNNNQETFEQPNQISNVSENCEDNIPLWKKYDISYITVLALIYIHAAGVYGGCLGCTQAKWGTVILLSSVWFLTVCGVVVGAHKLWAHRAFSASRSLEVFLMLCHSMSLQFTVFKWVAIHRQHHRYSDSPRDPHDSSRGLFYSHIGWLMVRKPGGDWDPSVLASMTDIKKNPVLEFQRRHATWLLPTFTLLLPSMLPLLWGESLWTSWHCNLFRLAINLNMALTVNSISHTWGYRPYDQSLGAYQSWFIIFLTLGEGHHNFHHVFPHDYRACEEDQRWSNIMALFIDVCAKLGLATRLRVAARDAVERKKETRGDGTRFGRSVLDYCGIMH